MSKKNPTELEKLREATQKQELECRFWKALADMKEAYIKNYQINDEYEDVREKVNNAMLEQKKALEEAIENMANKAQEEETVIVQP